MSDYKVSEGIAAVVLAAGLSSRMGTQKLLLPWGEGTVISHVVMVLSQAGIQKIQVVTGANAESMAMALSAFPVNLVMNPRYQEDSMLLSLQAGLASLDQMFAAALVVLGDQPQIKMDTVKGLVSLLEKTSKPLILPSYQMRRGHPWLLSRSLWEQVMAYPSSATLRDIFQRNEEKISYMEVDNDSILRDLDTPQDYFREVAERLRGI